MSCHVFCSAFQSVGLAVPELHIEQNTVHVEISVRTIS